MTTSRPNLSAGQELYALAKALLHVKTVQEAQQWVQHYVDWSKKWDAFLREKTYNERGSWDYTHDRLRRARNTVNHLLSKQVMFTYLEQPEYTRTNNLIEGKISAQLRCMLRNH